MKKSEKGITLVSLVITIVVLLILSGILVNVSIDNNPALEATKNIQNEYYFEKEKTQRNINSMVNGWEDVIF